MNSIEARLELAEKALKSAGFTQLSHSNEWKPPLGSSAGPLLDKIDQLKKLLVQLDECYCEIGFDMTRDDRLRHRKVLIEVRKATADSALETLV